MPTRREYIADEDNVVLIDDSEVEDIQKCVSAEENIHVNCDDDYAAEFGYGNANILDLEEPTASPVNLPTNRPKHSHNLKQMDWICIPKRCRVTSAHMEMRPREPEYEDGSVTYESDDPGSECESFQSEASFARDQQKTLLDIRNYCQDMYDIIQKLDKKVDRLHHKVSDLQHAQRKSVPLKPVDLAQKSQ